MHESKESGDRWGGAIWGLILVVIGGVLLADRFLDIPRDVWWSSWWTLVVMAAGLVRVITARDAKRLGEGVGCILFGVWLWISMTGWQGLHWGRSWPLILIAIGAQELTRGIAALWLPDPERKEVRRG